MPNFKKSTGFRMKGSPHKTGAIQGTSAHASALKEAESTRLKTIDIILPGQEESNKEPELKKAKTYEEVQKEIAEEKLSPRKKRRKEKRDLKKEYKKERKEEKDWWKDAMEEMSKEDKKTAKEVQKDERKAHKASYKKERKALKAKHKEEKSSKGPDIKGEDVKKQKRTKEQRAIDIRNTIAEIDAIIPSQFGGGRGVYAVQKIGDQGPSIDNKKGFSKNNKVSPEGGGGDLENKGKGNVKNTDNTNDSIIKANPNNNTSTVQEVNNQKKNQNKGSGPDWNTAPAVGTPERATWYKKNNLALDHTTPGGAGHDEYMKKIGKNK